MPPGLLESKPEGTASATTSQKFGMPLGLSCYVGQAEGKGIVQKDWYSLSALLTSQEITAYLPEHRSSGARIEVVSLEEMTLNNHSIAQKSLVASS